MPRYSHPDRETYGEASGPTGGVASGKSTVSAMLADLGAVVIDADLLAREVVGPGHGRAGRGGRGVRPRC